MDRRKEKLNVVFFTFSDDIQTGLDTYVNLLMLELKRRGYNSHIINFIEDDFYLPKTEVVNGSVIANIPMPANKKILLADINRQTIFFSQVFRMLSGYFSKKTNVIWHVQVLFLTKLACIFKDNFGGAIVSHVHIIPWKFLLDTNENLFNKFYQSCIDREYYKIGYDRFKKYAY